MLAGGTRLDEKNIAPLLPDVLMDAGTDKAEQYNEAMAAFERRLLRKTLDACGGSVPRAATRLGLGRSTLYKKMARLLGQSPNGDNVSM